MIKTPAELLRIWLQRQLRQSAWQWLEQQLISLDTHFSDRLLHTTLGMIPRRLNKSDLVLTTDELQAAQQARPGWDPHTWSVDTAARILVLCSITRSITPFGDRFAELCRYADVAELIAFYKGLPLYPVPERIEAQAADGLRTNMRAVFEAIAHRNPFPREYFDQNRWNHMVLKALFVGSPLWPIQGLDKRANSELARILCDYAHERWAANRAVSPELWRCIGPYAKDSALADLERVLVTGTVLEHRAAALALSKSPDSHADKLLAAPELAELTAMIRSGDMTWDTLFCEQETIV